MQPAGLGHRDRGGSQVLLEQASEMSLSHAQAPRQGLHVAVVQGPEVDQGEGARDRVGGPVPGAELRRGFRAASQAGPESGKLRRRRRTEEPHILRPGLPGRTDGPAIDSGRDDAPEQLPVEADVPGGEGAKTGGGIQVHGLSMVLYEANVWRFSDADSAVGVPGQVRAWPGSRSQDAGLAAAGCWALFPPGRGPRFRSKNLGAIFGTASSRMVWTVQPSSLVTVSTGRGWE